MPLSKERKQVIREQFRLHDSDTGSPEVQIAHLTQRIMDLTGHLASHIATRITQNGRTAPPPTRLPQA